MKHYPIDTIRQHLPQEELLTHLAEEAAELAQAALKLRRAYSDINPTPVSPEDAYEGLLEELADVQVCITALGFNHNIDHLRVMRISSQKMERWAKRLEAQDGVEKH